jgi:hypothetical protein
VVSCRWATAPANNQGINFGRPHLQLALGYAIAPFESISTHRFSIKLPARGAVAPGEQVRDHAALADPAPASFHLAGSIFLSLLAPVSCAGPGEVLLRVRSESGRRARCA